MANKMDMSIVKRYMLIATFVICVIVFIINIVFILKDGVISKDEFEYLIFPLSLVETLGLSFFMGLFGFKDKKGD